MDSQTRNMMIALVLGIAIIFISQLLFMPQQPTSPPASLPAQSAQTGAPAPDQAQPAAVFRERAAALANDPRIAINSPSLTGSINLRGARIDDLRLDRYRAGLESGSPTITLLSPAGAEDFYFSEFGWLATDGAVRLPDANTLWQAEGETLAPGTPLTLTWNNGQGLRFITTFSIDDDYLFTIERRVENSSEAPVALWPFGLITRLGTGDPSELMYSSYLVHLGPVGSFDGTLEELDYDDLVEDGPSSFASTGGWAGFADKYWFVALIPEQDIAFESRFFSSKLDRHDKYQVDIRGEALNVPAGGAVTLTDHLFAGAKKVVLLDKYEEELEVKNLDSVVFKFLWFLARPLFSALHFFHQIFGNFGLAILALTVCVRILLFPLANKSYAAMSKMKKLAPQMKDLRERYKGDRAQLNKSMMELYKREKVNPAAGCLPILAQIPIFFALYSVLFVAIEMRHAPFFGWIKDLSAPDPYTLFNLFGLIPWDPPSFLMIGAWPLIMGVTMFLQFKLNPTPPDPIQAKIMMFLPIIFVFILAPFPAGLVIYWSWNNILSVAQQWIIMRRMGVAVGGGSVAAAPAASATVKADGSTPARKRKSGPDAGAARPADETPSQDRPVRRKKGKKGGRRR